MANPIFSVPTNKIETAKRPPIVELSFVPTQAMKNESSQASLQEGPPKAPIDVNPAFSAVPQQGQPSKEQVAAFMQAAKKKRDEELQAVFLLGLAAGGIAVGGYFLIRWIFSKPETKEVLEEVVEEMTSS